MKIGKLFNTIDLVLLFAVIVLLCGGVAVIFSLTSGSGSKIYIDQSIFILLGLVVAGILTFFDYRVIRNFSWLIYFLSIISLIIVHFLGSSVFGATRWIDFGIFQFQPSELTKLALIIVVGHYLSLRDKITLKDLIMVIFLTFIPTILVFSQPDLGSASVLIVIASSLLLASKIPRLFIAVGIIFIMIIAPIGYNSLADYQKERISTFLNPNADPSGTGYNVAQSKIAIGSGGVFGRGLGKGSQSQLLFLPVAHTDFIFAGLAEATGFIGSFVLIILFCLIIFRTVEIAKLSQDSFGMYLALGIATQFIYQGFVNIGGNMGLVPITGIPLPFVSFGGTATIVMLAELGILESIYLRHKKLRFT